jgi:uncharacterized protein YbjT (DUF2867 family)/predicted DCC family thiol-disulfide oxidoreductase YuxK
MRIAITGGTGFVGGHLARSLAQRGHEVVILARGVDDRPWAQAVQGFPGVSFVRAGTDDESALREAFQGCNAVAHCSGINREFGSQTYEKVHVEGTANVVRAAEAAGVQRIALVSFLRARPNCGSRYHESKWQAEELVRHSTLDWTVLKPGMIFGRGDQMLDHLSHAIYTFPFFLGFGRCRIRPLAVEDLVNILESAIVNGRLTGQTVGVVGPTEVELDDAARLVARVIGKKRRFIAVPLAFHYFLASIAEATMKVPLISFSQIRILKEEVIEPVGAIDLLPPDLAPTTAFDEAAIRAGLPSPGRFGRADLRWAKPSGPRTSAADANVDAVLIFDGDCGFCTTAARWAERGFEHGERAEAWQFLSSEALASFGLEVSDVQSAAWWVEANGTRERGHRAIGHALHVAGGWKSAAGWLFLHAPVSWVAAGVYRLVVRWRYRLPGGTPACRIATQPSTKSPGE